MKMYLLDFGELSFEPGFFLEMGSCATLDNPSPPHSLIRAAMEGVLIDHPKDGLLLYEVGPPPNFKELWPEQVFQVFPVTKYSEDNRLDVILKKIGYSVGDISAIIIGHLHMDHAGGLEFFRGLDVPIYVHEQEIKYAFYSVATKQDFGPYLPHYLDPSFNWKPIDGEEVELFENITLYHLPGHTPGLIGMRVDLENSGTFLFTTDLVIHKENYEGEMPLGWLMRDRDAWFKSIRKIKALAKKTNAKLIFGHDVDVFNSLKHAPNYYE